MESYETEKNFVAEKRKAQETRVHSQGVDFIVQLLGYKTPADLPAKYAEKANALGQEIINSTNISDRNKEIVRSYFFDLKDGKRKSYRDVGEEFAMSRSRIGIIINESLIKARRNFDLLRSAIDLLPFSPGSVGAKVLGTDKAIKEWREEIPNLKLEEIDISKETLDDLESTPEKLIVRPDANLFSILKLDGNINESSEEEIRQKVNGLMQNPKR